MAQAETNPNRAAHIFSIICFVSAICMASSSLLTAEAKSTNITLYLQDYASGPNATFFPVVGLPGKELNYTTFGTFFVTDDPITECASEDSRIIGRAQGIYVVTGLDGKNLMVLLSLVFTDGSYNGSTIEIQGTSKQFDPARELAVIAGTGIFRFARGFMKSDVISFDAARGYSLVEANLTVLH